MFKKFHPKDDIASSTSIKSSVQRSIRSKLLSQIPLLSAPALPAPPNPDASDDDDDSEDDAPLRPVKKKGAGKDKRAEREKGGGKGGKARKGAEEQAVPLEQDDEMDKDGVLTLLDVLWPKKEGITLIKCRDHISILALHGEPLFFQHFDGPYYPTLKLLHRYPTMLPHVQVDRGAIKFVMAGANIMCPGLTSPTASLPEENFPVGTPVAVHAYGKEHALGIGLLTMSTDDIKRINKNVGVENVAFLGDDLWAVSKL